MRILIFPGFLDDTWSSIEKRYLWLDPALREIGDCYWLVPWRQDPPEPRYSAELGKIGANLLFADLKTGRPMANAQRIARILKAHRIDLVYTHFGPLRYEVEAVAHLLGVRVVRGEHNFAFHADRRLRFIKRLFWRWAIDYFIPVSYAVATHLKESGVMRDNGMVVYDGFDADDYPEPAMEASRTEVLQELEIDGQPKLLVCVAKLHPAKQQHLLVDMLARLRDPNTLLLFVGASADESYVGALKAQADRLGVTKRIRFLGYRTDVARLMDAAHATYLPSRAEGLGNVLIESGFMATPTIAANLPAIREVIEDGHNGYLVADDAPLQYAMLTDRLLADEDLRRRMGTCARVEAIQRFGREAFVKQTLEALKASMCTC